MSWESSQQEAIQAAVGALRRCGMADAVGLEATAAIVTITLHAATPVIEKHLLAELDQFNEAR